MSIFRVAEAFEEAMVAQQGDTDRYAEFREKYRANVVRFAEDCFYWSPGEKLASYQAETLEGVYEYGRYAERIGRGGGKTATAAILTHHFALTNDIDFDWKIPTTAGSWAQLDRFLWPEIRKWGGMLRWDIIGRAPYNRRREMMELTLKLNTGEAFAIATDRPELIEGAHASKLLLILDEAKAIDEPIWDAVEGSMSAGECYSLAISTPGEKLGRFFHIHRGEYKNWKTKHVTAEQAIAAGRMKQKWYDDQKEAWLVKRPDLWANHVEAEFYTTSPDTLIPMHWLDRAFQRYEIAERDGIKELNRNVNRVFGVDVAEYGGDRFVITHLAHNIFWGQQVYEKLDIMQGTGHVVGAVGTDKETRIAVDANGVGAGVWARLKELGYKNAKRVMVSTKTDAKDRHKTNTFVSLKDYMYWLVREALDPENEPENLLALPDIPALTEELTTPKWSRRSNGEIEVEKKEKIVERLKRSPDLFESLALALLAAKQGTRGWNVY
jgi:hypothetical protein